MIPGLLITMALLVSLSQEDELERISGQLDEIVQQYTATEDGEKVENLVTLDGRVRKLLDEPWQQAYRSFDGRVWKPAWSQIGVYVGHYSDSLGYSGKLLVEAHRTKPFSNYRRFTLFSAILGEGSDSGLGEMPDLQAALQYLEEFPDGPFADETSIILGGFYEDLFKVLKELQEGLPHNYKYQCFSKYVTNATLTDQASAAQGLSVRYYSRALNLRSESGSEWAQTKAVRRWKLEMQEGKSTGWHFCAD